MNILVTGASGFVGKALLERLIKEGHQVTALSREKKKSKKHEKVKWLQGDLIKAQTLPELGPIDKAFYLVHGLKGEIQNFEYQESLAAVNFVNWVRPSGSEIIYLGALGPELDDLSPHLRSRQLTGAILGASALGTIEFRASIILGEGSLSFEMIKALVERLPVRPVSNLLESLCQPLALDDLLNYLISALKYHPQGHEIIEIGGPDVCSYGQLMDVYARGAKVKRLKVKVPDIDLRILMLVLDYAIPELSDIGKKLTVSLEHPTIVTDFSASKKFPEIKPMGMREAMKIAIAHSKTHYAPLWEKDFLMALLSDKISVEKVKEILKKK